MHGPLVSAEQVDDFNVLRARMFTVFTRHRLTHEVSPSENLAAKSGVIDANRHKDICAHLAQSALNKV